MNCDRFFIGVCFFGFRVFVLFILGMICVGGVVLANDVQIIKNPTPTCEEMDYCKLIKVAEMAEQEEVFLIQPSSLVADDSQNVYVFDRRHVKIFKFDKNLNFVKSHGSPGKGPGEFGSKGIANISLTIGKDNILYAGDRFNRKIHCFNLDLKLIKTIKLEGNGQAPITPVLDKKQNIYLYSNRKGSNVLDVYDLKGNVVNSLMDKKELKIGLFHIFPGLAQFNYNMSHPKNIGYDFMGDNFYIFSFLSGYLYQFENLKVKSKTALWPKKALIHYQSQLTKFLKEDMYLTYFQKFFIDHDTQADLYLAQNKEPDKERFLLYRFDGKGSLKNVLVINHDSNDSTIRLHFKKNNLFYGIKYTTSDEIKLITFKEGTIK